MIGMTESMSDLTAKVGLVSLGGGVFGGIYLADLGISRVRDWAKDDTEDVPKWMDEVVTEGLLSALCFVAPPLLLMLTEPIVQSVDTAENTIGIALGWLVRGFEIGISIRGMKGMIMATMAMLNSK